MKRFGLAISISALTVLAFSSAAAAALRVDSDGMYASTRDISIIVERGGDARLEMLNERLYPDTDAVAPIDDENAALRFAFRSGPRDPPGEWPYLERRRWNGAGCPVGSDRASVHLL